MDTDELTDAEWRAHDEKIRELERANRAAREAEQEQASAGETTEME